MTSQLRIKNEFSGKKVDWECCFEKFISCGKCKVYKKLLVSSESMVGGDKVPMQDVYENALEGDMDLDKKLSNSLLK